MARNRKIFWFAYFLFLFGICGIHRWYFFGVKSKHSWTLLYGSLLVLFALGVFNIYDKLLLVYILIFILQLCDGIFIKWTSRISGKPLIFGRSPAKANNIPVNIVNDSNSKNFDNLRLEVSEFEPDSAPTAPHDPGIRETNEKDVDSEYIQNPTTAFTKLNDTILKFLETQDKGCTHDEIYGKIRPDSESEDSKRIIEEHLDRLHMDKKIRIEGTGKDQKYFIWKHANPASSNPVYNDSHLTRQSSDISDP
jgi:hypothetical protein